MLTQREAVSFILERKLFSPAHVVDGDLTVADVSRRHHGYKVTAGSAPGYILKQGVGQDKVKAIEREAQVYRFLASQVRALDPYLPRVHDYDASEHVLILEMVGQGQSLRDYHAQRGHFSLSLARVLGTALGALHGVTKAGQVLQGAQRQAERFAGQRPWVFDLHRPKFKFVQDCSNANLQLVRTIQQFPEYCEQLDMMRDAWRIETLTHQDMRWDNCIVYGTSPSARQSRLKIIDWEIAGLGDPCWDVGSVFNDYLSFWLLSMPVTGDMPPERFLELARYPLEKMQPALNAFWDSYIRKLQMDTATADQALLRSVQYAAVRLLQTAFEQLQSSMRLTGNMVCMLQLSLNMLLRPQEATIQLLGLPLQETWPS